MMSGWIHLSVNARMIPAHAVEASQGRYLHLSAIVNVVTICKRVVGGRFCVDRKWRPKLQVGVGRHVAVVYQRLVAIATPAVLTGSCQCRPGRQRVLGSRTGRGDCRVERQSGRVREEIAGTVHRCGTRELLRRVNLDHLSKCLKRAAHL